MNEIISAITQSGLNNTEARVYHALLKKGELSVSALAKESNMSRANVYVILKRLDMSGLISYSKVGKREYVSAVHPNRLRQIVNLRRNRFEDDFEKLKNLYEEGSLNKPKVQIFEGIKSVRLVYKEVLEKLKKKEKLRIFTNIGTIEEKVPEVLVEFKRIIGAVAYKSDVHELTYNNKKSHDYYHSIKSKIGKGYQLRFAPRDLDFGENEQFILEDKIIYFSLRENIFVIIVDNIDLARTQGTMFDMAWQQGILPEQED